MTKETIKGPGNIRLELDSAQIFPDDPGQGTPAMIHLGLGSATYWCALNEGEVFDTLTGTIPFSGAQMRWLEAQEEVVDAFLTKHS
jgi:hypothetical protein